jgi:hypothetical protein
MTAKKLTVKGITFPNFGDDDSKKNFRLIFHIGYTDKDGNEAIATVSKPDSGHWQWKNKNKDAYLKPKIVGDSVELDTIVLKNGDGKKIPGFANKIAEIDGDITDISAQFIDVSDKNLSGFFVKDVLPDVIAAWKLSGLDPIDMAPIPGGVKIIVKSKLDLQKIVDSTAGFLTKKAGDKVLHSLAEEYEGQNPFVLKEDGVEWGDGKTGTYAVTIGVA